MVWFLRSRLYSEDGKPNMSVQSMLARTTHSSFNHSDCIERTSTLSSSFGFQYSQSRRSSDTCIIKSAKSSLHISSRRSSFSSTNSTGSSCSVLTCDPSSPCLQDEAAAPPALPSKNELIDIHSSYNRNCSSLRSSIESMSLDRLQVEITGFSLDKDGVVMYHLDVTELGGTLLSTYSLRKRFTDFKQFHETLRVEIEYQLDHVDASDKQCKPTMELLSKLPPLPVNGVWSYLMRHDFKLLRKRQATFQALMDYVIRNRNLLDTKSFGVFIGVAPSSVIQQQGSLYVSLKDYDVPSLYHRKRRTLD